MAKECEKGSAQEKLLRTVFFVVSDFLNRWTIFSSKAANPLGYDTENSVVPDSGPI